MNKKNLVVIILVLICIIGTGKVLMSQEMVITQKDGSVRAMPVNEIDHIKFRETGTVTDYEGNVYKTVKIGNQWWMAENLRVTKLNNGKSIDKVTDATAWEILNVTETPAYCAYNNNDDNASIYGYLYNWYAVETGKLAPAGWHVPTDDEWKELEMALGMSESQANILGWRQTNEGSKLAGRADLWIDGSLENNAEFGTSGFAGLPAGNRSTSGFYSHMGSDALFWTATDYSSNFAWYRNLDYNDARFCRTGDNKVYGFSVRCVKD